MGIHSSWACRFENSGHGDWSALLTVRRGPLKAPEAPDESSEGHWTDPEQAGGSSRHRAWGVHRAPQSPETTDPPKWSKHIQVVQGPPELPGMFVPCRSNLHFSWGKAPCTRCAVLTVWMELVSLEISGIFRWRLCSTYVVCI